MAFIVKESTPDNDTIQIDNKIITNSSKTSNNRQQTNKVCLGATQSCSCHTFQSEHELCVHLLWIMLRVFKISKEDDILFQLSLVDREIAQMMQNRTSYKREKVTEKNKLTSEECDHIHTNQRKIEDGDVCVICQEDLLGSSPITFCKKSCGNNLHTKCLKILMEHQFKSLGLDIVKCPLCRNEFGTVDEINSQIAFVETPADKKKKKKQIIAYKHFGTTCFSCKVSPIVGNYQRCVVCKHLLLCDICFKKGEHEEHSFEHKSNKRSIWTPSQRVVSTIIPTNLLNQLQSRELGDQDYDTLLALDQKSVQGNIPLHIVNSFPLSINRVYKSEEECTVCCLKFSLGCVTRKIPCGHFFHQACIDRWLLQRRSTCPTCGVPAYTSNNHARNSSKNIDLELEYTPTPVQYKPENKKMKKKKKKSTSQQQPTPQQFQIVGNNLLAQIPVNKTSISTTTPKKNQQRKIFHLPPLNNQNIQTQHPAPSTIIANDFIVSKSLQKPFFTDRKEDMFTGFGLVVGSKAKLKKFRVPDRELKNRPVVKKKTRDEFRNRNGLEVDLAAFGTSFSLAA